MAPRACRSKKPVEKQDTTEKVDDEKHEEADDEFAETKKRTRTRTVKPAAASKKAKKEESKKKAKDEAEDEEEANEEGEEEEADGDAKTSKAKAKSKKSTASVIDRPADTREHKFDSAKQWKFVSWNVNGIRAVLNKDKGVSFSNLFQSEKPDVLCVQELKISQAKLDAAPEKKQIESLVPDYVAHYNCCEDEDKSGCYGTAMFIKKEHSPIVTKGIGIPKHDREGRVTTAEFDKFFLITAYVPNSGIKLERLSYRTKEWDSAFFGYIKGLEQKKPVIICGDLNCALLDIDVHTPKTCVKTAGFTPQERQEFRKLFEHGLVDSFREFYKDQAGWFTYWSYKFGSKEKNKGWRLDYFLTSASLRPSLADSFVIREVEGSDHVPIVLHLNKTSEA